MWRKVHSGFHVLPRRWKHGKRGRISRVKYLAAEVWQDAAACDLWSGLPVEVLLRDSREPRASAIPVSKKPRSISPSCTHPDTPARCMHARPLVVSDRPRSISLGCTPPDTGTVHTWTHACLPFGTISHPGCIPCRRYGLCMRGLWPDQAHQGALAGADGLHDACMHAYRAL